MTEAGIPICPTCETALTRDSLNRWSCFACRVTWTKTDGLAFAKPQRVVDFALLADTRQKPCCVCGRGPCDPCHIRSRGSGGPDTDWNVVPMCRKHHTEQHSKGWVKFLKNHASLASQLEAKGWLVGDKAPNGRLWHPGLSTENQPAY